MVREEINKEVEEIKNILSVNVLNFQRLVAQMKASKSVGGKGALVSFSECGTLEEALKDMDNAWESLTCFMNPEDEGEVCFCERCGKELYCEAIPMMGFSKWLCRGCAAAAYRSGEAV